MVVKTKRILVLDDEPQVTQIIKRLLVMHEYEVIELNDPLRLEDYVLYTDLDLIITDLDMPRRTGMEVLKVVRLSKPTIPVVILTGHATIDNAVESTKLGAAAFLSKPVKSDELIATVNKFARPEKAISPVIRKILESKIDKGAKTGKFDQERILLDQEIVSTDTLPAGFIEVDMNVIIPGESVPFDIFIQIYVKQEGKHYLRRLCPADTVFSSGLRNILHRRGLASIYIQEKDYRAYLKYYSNLKGLPSFRMEKIKDEKKLILYGKAIEAVTEILSDHIGATNVKAGVVLLDDIIKTMVKDPDIFQDMYLLFKKDSTIFNHSANVTLLVTSFALYLNIEEKAIKVLGLGALFHDIGLNKIDKSILNKADPLTPEEWAIIKSHPERGANILKASLIYPPPALRIVMEHHEESNGSGYPQGLAGAQISNFAKMVHIVDKFDSMTTDKPYRAAFTPAEALKRIYVEESQEKYRKFVRQFINFLAGKK